MNKLIFYLVGLLLLATPALAQNTIPYESGTGGLTNGNLVKSGATVGQLQDAALSAAQTPQLNVAGAWTAAQTFAAVLGGENDQSGTTYTLAATDCGKTVAISNASAITVTIAASIVPAAGTTCNIAIRQDGAGQISVTGSAVTAATLVSAHSYTKTFGIHAIIGLELTTIGATATAVLTGDGA